MKIIDISEMKAGVSGLDVSGKIEKIFDVKEHQGEYGTWYSQNVCLADETGKIYVSLVKAQLAKDDWMNKEVKFDLCKVTEYTNKEGKTIKTLQSKWTPIKQATEEKIVKEEKKEQEIKHTPVNDSPVTDWNAKEKRDKRAMCISYAKDLTIATIIDQKEMFRMASMMFGWIYEEAEQPEVEQDKNEITIPF